MENMSDLMRRAGRQNKLFTKDYGRVQNMFDQFEEELKQLHKEEVLVKSEKASNERAERLKKIRARIRVLESTIRDLEIKIAANKVQIAVNEPIMKEQERLFLERYGQTIAEYRKTLVS